MKDLRAEFDRDERLYKFVNESLPTHPIGLKWKALRKAPNTPIGKNASKRHCTIRSPIGNKDRRCLSMRTEIRESSVPSEELRDTH